VKDRFGLEVGPSPVYSGGGKPRRS
jgi:hypothetical protein